MFYRVEVLNTHTMTFSIRPKEEPLVETKKLSEHFSIYEYSMVNVLGSGMSKNNRVY